MRNVLVIGGVGVGLGALVGLILGFGFGATRSEPMAMLAGADMAVMEEARRAKDVEAFAAPAPAAPMEEGLQGQLGIGLKGYGAGGGSAQMKRSASVLGVLRGQRAGGAAAEALAEPLEDAEPGAAASRAWFPETFLFEPLVVTDASGAATVPVKVPDRLTRWRVLALGHSRSGAQAGALASFSGTLPTYVDPVLPGFLRAGDVVRLPVQVVNTTQAPLEQPLKVVAEGAALEGGAARTVRVPARGSVVEYFTVRTARPGPVTVRASLGSADAVVRTFDVWPTGRPVVETRGGSLAAPRSLSLTGAADAQPGSERVRLLVYPGALGMLRAELSAALGRGGVAEDAYALLLAGRAPALLESLGEVADAEALKTMTALSGQRVLKAARAPQVATAALLAEAALAHPGNPVLARLGERMAAQVAQAQRPDGTCQGEDGWTLQRLLVATSECTQAVRAAGDTASGRQRAARFTVRASGAFERNLSHVRDGYTAAALLASGAVGEGTVREALRQRVREALKRREDGAAYLPVETGVVRGDGQVPSEVEATALAVLALEGDAAAPMADLGTSLLAGYRPAWGWGDGRANLVGLRAALALFREPLLARVRVVLERDGQEVTQGTLDAQALREVLALEADASGSAGAHTWTVRAEPPVPGLGFSLSLVASVPWKPSEARGGVELAVKGPTEAKVGQAVELTVQAVAPAGLPLKLRQGLPAGVQVDKASLDALVAEGRVASYDVEDGAVTLTLRASSTGRAEPFTGRFRVVPTLAGTLQGGASSLTSERAPHLAFHVPPVTWAVR